MCLKMAEMMICCVQGLEEQVPRLDSQIREQEEKVSKVASDPREVKKLEAEIKKKTQGMTVAWLLDKFFFFSILQKHCMC